MKRSPYDVEYTTELLYQALETELAGAHIYKRAITAAVDDDLRDEWKKYLRETKHHQEVLLGVFDELGLDPEVETQGRETVRQLGQALVNAIDNALVSGDEVAAQLVAGECVVLAETKDHMNWELIGHVARHGEGSWTDALDAAFSQVEHDESHHLYHTRGWTRELWIEALGMPAALPPPEEITQVDTADGAVRAERAREQFAHRH